MPGKDGTGPQGAGAGTGGWRGFSFSHGGTAAGSGNQRVSERCQRFGPGRCSDWGQVLRNKAFMLERELEEVRRCISDYETGQG